MGLHERAYTNGMSPNSDEYWVGRFAMSVAIARSWLIQGRIDQALHALDEVLEQFGLSKVCDPGLRKELSEYWEPKGEGEMDDDRHVLRSLRE